MLISASIATGGKIVQSYARTWQLLWQYDEDSLPMPRAHDTDRFQLPELGTVRAASLKKILLGTGEATDIFGH